MIDEYTDKIYEAIKGKTDEDELKEAIYNVLDKLLDDYFNELYKQIDSSFESNYIEFKNSVLRGIEGWIGHMQPVLNAVILLDI